MDKNPGGSYKAISDNLDKELKGYKKLGNHVKRYKFASKYCKGLKVLEVGCGYGFGALLLNGEAEYVGVDIDHEAIKWANGHINKGRFFLLENLEEMYSSAYFDIVISFEVIEHVSDPKNLLNILKSNAKPNGKIIVSTPNGYYSHHIQAKFRSPYHIDEYNALELLNIIEDSGFHKFELFKEQRIDHLDSRGIKEMERNRNSLPKGGTNLVTNIFAKFFNGPSLWKITQLNLKSGELNGYSTILAILDNEPFE